MRSCTKKINIFAYTILVFAMVFSVSFAFFSPSFASAETGIPTPISYQGHLTDSGGNPLGGAGTPYFFKFSLWDSPTVGSGTKVWPTSNPNSTSLSVKQGVFNVNIGDTENGYPDTLDYNWNSNKKVYLQVEISSDNSNFETLSPRSPINSTPFSQVASQVSGVGQSSFGTTTPFLNTLISAISTSINSAVLSIKGIAGQVANLFNIFDSNGNTLFTVSPSGNVGVGTSTPESKFGILTGANTVGLSVFGSLGQVSDYVNVKDNNGTSVFSLDKMGNVTLQNPVQSVLTLALKNTISEAGADESIVEVWGQNRAMFVGKGNTGTQLFNMGYNSNVGGVAVIGYGAGTAIRMNSGHQTSIASGESDFVGRLTIKGVSAGTDIVGVFKGGTSQTADLTQWRDSSNNILSVVTAGGNVGIGTTMPSAKLDVNGSVLVNNMIAGQGILGIKQTSNTNQGGLTLYNSGDSASVRLWIDNSNVARFDSNSSAGGSISFNGSGTGKIGIGTTTPNATLEVNGAVLIGSAMAAGNGILGVKQVSNTNIGGFTLYNSAASASARWWIGSDNVQHIDNGFSANGDISLNNGKFYLQGSAGNIGIGTTSPADKLDVWGAVRSSVTGASVSYTAFNPGNGYPRGQMLIDYNNSAPVNVAFSVAPAYGNNSQFYQTSLAVENNKVGTNSGYRTAGISQGIGFASIYAIGGSQGNGAGDPLKFSTQTYLGNNSGLVINNDTNQTVNIGTDILSTTNQLNVVPRSTLNAAYFGGNVGIGTTNPGYKLEISNPADSSALMVKSQIGSGTIGVVELQNYNDSAPFGTTIVMNRARGTIASPTQIQTNDVIGGFYGKGYTNSSAFGTSNVTAFRMLAAENFTLSAQGTYIDFATTPIGSATRATRMTIDNAGNVGIGTTTPIDTLEVKTAGQGSITLGGSNGRTIRAFNATGGASNFDMLAAATYFSGNALVGGMLFARGGILNDTAAYLTINGGTNGSTYFSGNVGIGITTPAYPLQVKGTKNGVIGSLTADLSAVGDYMDLQFNPGTGGVINNSIRLTAGSAGARLMQIIAGGTTTATFNNSGNVGIGTATPTSKLDVYDATSATFRTNSGTRSIYLNSFAGDWNYNTSTGAPYIIGTQDANQFYIYQNNVRRLGFYANETVVNESGFDNNFRIKSMVNENSFFVKASTGNVGIGTTTPSAQLHTTGTVRFSTFTAGSLQTDADGNLTVSSDEKLKDIQDNFTRGLADLQKINPISYRWNVASGYDTKSIYSGFSAQNIQLAIPEAVSTSSNGYLALSDRPIIATLVNAVKEIANKFESILVWFGGDGSKFNISGEVCVDNVCVTKDQFKAMLQKAGGETIVPNVPSVQSLNTETPAMSENEKTETGSNISNDAEIINSDSTENLEDVVVSDAGTSPSLSDTMDASNSVIPTIPADAEPVTSSAQTESVQVTPVVPN